MNPLTKINALKTIPHEQWHKHGITLLAVSANSNGIVNSGIIKLNNQKLFFSREYKTETNKLGIKVPITNEWDFVLA